MSPAVLVIGANGQVGSATVRAALQRSYPTYAFLRNPSKLPTDISSHTSLQVIQGDAKDSQALRAALSKKTPPIDAVIITAPMGDMRGRRSGYEEINQKIIEAVQEEQKESGRKIKVWMMAGSAILEHPEIPGKYLNELMPMTFYPEYAHTIRFLEEKAQDVNWTINAPALIKKGKPVGPLVEGITSPPLWKKPFGLTKWIPFQLGYAGNTMYNWTTQNITFQSLGEYMVDNLDLSDRLRHKRVGVLEDPSAKR